MKMPKKPYTNKRIGDILIEQGLITPQQLEEALKLQKEGNKRRLGEALIEIGAITNSSSFLLMGISLNRKAVFFDIEDITSGSIT